jgi:glycosyltransferase involved in cell wall biosynthesis
MRAFFSVVIPVKNRKKELIRCLVSLSHQTFEDFEVVVIDDNSNDDYTKLIRYFKNLNIKLFKNEGVGANSARNLGASKAHSKYIAFLDSDDIFLPNKLSDIYDVICSSQTNICVSQLLVWRGSPRMQLRPLRGPQDKQDISEYFFVDDCRIQSSSFVRKGAME